MPIKKTKRVARLPMDSSELRKMLSKSQKKESPPSYHALINSLSVPKDAYKALKIGVPAEERLLRKESRSQRVLDLDTMLALHLKNLAVWRRKGILDKQKFDTQLDRAWKTYLLAHKIIFDPIDVRSASAVELMRKTILEQGGGYYQSVFGPKKK